MCLMIIRILKESSKNNSVFYFEEIFMLTFLLPMTSRFLFFFFCCFVLNISFRKLSINFKIEWKISLCSSKNKKNWIILQIRWFIPMVLENFLWNKVICSWNVVHRCNVQSVCVFYKAVLSILKEISFIFYELKTKWS